ncbi:hypothetical protein F1559_004822 [Cyanidiococcus yangmingshanensis]|uniref:Uncharacterized protein n=1 Tax=Cyanidiococcus yangmingshanensis TaxID=2690220 RepID=A0A7J7IRL7_9RHOD|nr:hypothetical protein F1559_004822 [Cyanidiococcus yangmingshanensis]
MLPVLKSLPPLQVAVGTALAARYTCLHALVLDFFSFHLLAHSLNISGGLISIPFALLYSRIFALSAFMNSWYAFGFRSPFGFAAVFFGAAAALDAVFFGEAIEIRF